MELKDRKRIQTRANINQYGGDVISTAIPFGAAIAEDFQLDRSREDIAREAGSSEAQGAGFVYNRQNNIDRQKELEDLRRQSAGNAVKSTGTGAAFGAAVGSIFPGAGTVIGGALGAVAGALTGWIGAKRRRNALKRRIFDAQQQINRNNDYSLSSAHSDYLANQYALNHENTADDILYGAKCGKDKYRLGKNTYGTPNAWVSGGESIVSDLEDVENAQGVFVDKGKPNADDQLAYLRDKDIVLGKDIDWRDGESFKNKAVIPTQILEYTNKIENGLANASEKTREVQQRELNKIKTPAVENLKDLADQQKYQHEMKKYTDFYMAKCGKDKCACGKDKMRKCKNGWELDNLFLTGLGASTGLAQYFGAKKQRLNTPDILSSNPYEQQVLTAMANRRSNPYPIINELYQQNRRNQYAINRGGGVTGPQSYFANIASNLGSLNAMAKIYADSQKENNTYIGEFSKLAAELGAQQASRNMAARQYTTDYLAKAHAAQMQEKQMGIYNLLNQLQQGYANASKYGQFKDMYSLYNQRLDQDKKKLAQEYEIAKMQYEK